MLNIIVSASWRKLALTQVVFISNPDSGHLGPHVLTRSVLRRPSFDREASALTVLSCYYGETMRISFGNESILLCRHVGRHIVNKNSLDDLQELDVYFQMRPCISIKRSIRPSICHSSIHPSVMRF